MKLKTISKSNEYGDNTKFVVELRNDSDLIVLRLDFCNGEPEDNSLGRNFNDVFYIEEAIRIAYEAGKNGEKLEVENVQK